MDLSDVGARFRGLRALLAEAWLEFRDDDCARLGASLAYATLFSITPLLLVATAIAGLLFDAAEARAAIEVHLRAALGPEGATTVVGMLGRALPRGAGIVSSVVGVLAVIFGASTLFVELRAALNRVWDVPVRRGGLHVLLRERLRGAAMVLGVGFLLLASLAASTVLRALEGVLGSAPPVALEAVDLAWPILSLAITSGLFAVLFKALPDRKIAWRDVAVGAVVTAALFSVGRAAIAMYLAYSSISTVYGAAGSLVALLVWVYYSAQILLFGAEITQVFARRAGSQRADEGLLQRK